MAKATWIKVSGTWKKVKNVWEKVGGVWKQKVIPKGRVSGSWKDFIGYNEIYVSSYTASGGYVLEKRDLSYNLMSSITISSQAKSIACDKDGNVFIVTGSGVYFYNKDLVLVKSITSTIYDSIAVNNTGKIMIGSRSATYFYILDYNFNYLTGAITVGVIIGIDSDSDGNFYISMGIDSTASDKKISKYTSSGPLVWTTIKTTSTGVRYYKIRTNLGVSFAAFYNSANWVLRRYNETGVTLTYADLPYSPSDGITITKNGEPCLLLTDGKYRKYSNDLSAVATSPTSSGSVASNSAVRDLTTADDKVIGVAEALNGSSLGGVSCYDTISNAILWNYTITGYLYPRICATPGNVGSFLSDY